MSARIFSQKYVSRRPVTSLGQQEGRRVFQEGPNFFELCPIFLNYVQHIFTGGEKNFLGGGFAYLVTGLISRKLGLHMIYIS